ncbi:MAG: 50S ribosomal protein L18 [Anaerolineaceae bacterium]|nr:50S ribosomal protein L18 [Anaerolineaceae bacterium]MCY3936629.1 50S ribosomal protein L18 [Chloroflexota bacterium]MCY4009362.1 50S ribosomal protein L18 [Anaerolineaceae bacterium]
MADIQGKRKREARKRRQRRIRARVQGSAERPRLNVFRSANHIYAQLIDDGAGVTLASASTLDQALREAIASLKKAEAARLVGQTLGERALAAGLQEAVFDRGGYRYHGRVAALAEGARAAGLKI